MSIALYLQKYSPLVGSYIKQINSGQIFKLFLAADVLLHNVHDATDLVIPWEIILNLATFGG